jgi:hypothetical protein
VIEKPLRYYLLFAGLAATVSFLLYRFNSTDEAFKLIGNLTALTLSAALIFTLAYSRIRALRSEWIWSGVTRNEILRSLPSLLWGPIGFPIAVFAFLFIGIGRGSEILERLPSLPSGVLAAALAPGLSGFVFFWIALVLIRTFRSLNLFMPPEYV